MILELNDKASSIAESIITGVHDGEIRSLFESPGVEDLLHHIHSRVIETGDIQMGIINSFRIGAYLALSVKELDKIYK